MSLCGENRWRCLGGRKYADEDPGVVLDLASLTEKMTHFQFRDVVLLRVRIAPLHMSTANITHLVWTAFEFLNAVLSTEIVNEEYQVKHHILTISFSPC